MSLHTAYTAGPWIFSPKCAEIGTGLVDLCRKHGLVAVLPYDGEKENDDAAGTIYRHNLDRIERSDCVVADLSPFRGPHMDVGTAFEIGYAAALKKPVFGYSCSPRPLIERIWCEETPTGWRDAHGKLVENFDMLENLMIGRALAASVSASPDQAFALAAAYFANSGE